MQGPTLIAIARQSVIQLDSAVLNDTMTRTLHTCAESTTRLGTVGR